MRIHLHRLLICLALLAWIPGALASTIAPAERIDRLQAALEGDLDALDALRGDEEPGRWDRFYRGYALEAAGHDEAAVSAWQEAVALGHRVAVRALAAHHYERREWMEAYAWARLAMEVEAALADLEMDDLRGGWNLYTAIHAAEELEPAQHAAADALARERIDRHLARLVEPEEVGSIEADRVRDLEIVERTAPVYPRSMVENARPGWSYLQFEILDDGRVGEVVVVGASHDRFGRAAARAIRKWRFNADALDDLPTIGTQQIDFNLD